MATTFGILGELEVVQDGERRDLGSIRQRSLLARLIIRAGQPLSIGRLIEELWPDEVPDTARHALHVYVSRLRAALGPERSRLTSDASGYRLRVEPDELDASRFERLSAEGRAARSQGQAELAASRLREALGTWRGPALAEFADEPFASAEATRLDQLRLGSLEERLWADLELGHDAALADELRRLTLEQPFRETFWEQYMLALYRAGRQADALHVFGEARTRLADELGIEPGPSLRRMEQRILVHHPALTLQGNAAAPAAAAPEPPCSRLPLERTSFVGRERDLAIAGEVLAASRLLTLTGAPGSGKTRMALRLASDQRRCFPDGAFFVPLAAVTEARLLESAVLAVLDPAEPSGAGGRSRVGTPRQQVERQHDRLVERLRGRRVLLLLDNLEQLAGAAEPVGRLLDEAAGVTIIATSRSGWPASRSSRCCRSRCRRPTASSTPPPSVATTRSPSSSLAPGPRIRAST